MDKMQTWQSSLLVAGMTFAGLSAYNKMTHDPHEVSSNAYIAKASLIAAASLLLVSGMSQMNVQSVPSEQILTRFE